MLIILQWENRNKRLGLPVTAGQHRTLEAQHRRQHGFVQHNSADEISTRSQSEPKPTGFCTTLLWTGIGREGFVYVRPFVQDIVMWREVGWVGGNEVKCVPGVIGSAVAPRKM